MVALILSLHGLPILYCKIVHVAHQQPVELGGDGKAKEGGPMFGDSGLGCWTCSDDDHSYSP